MDSPETVPAVELRLSISDTEPLIWRQLVLPESATVAELHGAIQCAFGWKNSHLYAVAGNDRSGTKRIFMNVDDGDGPEGGEDPAAVRLLELFDPQKPGVSDLLYEYDFGDSWTHDIEVVGPAVLHENSIACLDGAMRGPIEDSGGVGGYANVVAVVSNPKHPEHREAIEWLEFVTQESVSKFDPTAFDLVAINGQLRSLAQRFWPSPVTTEDREAVLAPILWFLREARPEGLQLTPAGYLKPIIIKQALDSIGWNDDWYRDRQLSEAHVGSIRILREQLQEWKLLRKSKDRLLLTPAGRKLVDDSEGLWSYLADRLADPVSGALRLATELKVYWELSGNLPPRDLRAEVVQHALHEAGFRTQTGGTISAGMAYELEVDVYRTFLCLGVWNGNPWELRERTLSDAGVKFLLDVQSRMD